MAKTAKPATRAAVAKAAAQPTRRPRQMAPQGAVLRAAARVAVAKAGAKTPPSASRKGGAPAVKTTAAGQPNGAAHPPLAPVGGFVRYVGEPVAAIIAEDQYSARDAADLVEVDYESQPAVVDMEKALGPESALVHTEFGTNQAFVHPLKNGDI